MVLRKLITTLEDFRRRVLKTVASELLRTLLVAFSFSFFEPFDKNQKPLKMREAIKNKQFECTIIKRSINFTAKSKKGSFG